MADDKSKNEVIANLTEINEILDWFNKAAKQQIPVDAGMWINKAMELNALKESLDDAIVVLENEVAKKMEDFLSMNPKVNIAEVRVKATDTYKRLNIYKAKEKRVMNFIQLAKKQTDVKQF